MVDIDRVVAYETAVWQALVDGDATADAELLAPEFVGVTPTGVAGRDAHAGALTDGPTVVRFEITEPRLLTVSDDAVLLIYRAVYEPVGPDASSGSMWVSSLWCRRGDRWVNVFSQDTPDTGIPVV